MIRPQKMKHLEMTVHIRDIDSVIEYLGRRGLMHFSDDTLIEKTGELNAGQISHIQENLNRLHSAALYLGFSLPEECEEDTMLPADAEDRLSDTLVTAILGLSAKEKEQEEEKKKLQETLGEARSFSKINAPFSELEQLSYLTLRVGRLDPKRREELRENLADRAVIIPLDDSGRILAAASRKGRFALDSALKKLSFTPIAIPKDYTGIPTDILDRLAEKIAEVERDLKAIAEKKKAFKEEYGPSLKKLTASYLMARAVEELKGRLRGTQDVFVIGGWVPADEVAALVEEMDRRTEGRAAIRSYDPEEFQDVREGKKKVPVSLKHGAFVRGFEPLVFSYGAPLYGTLDPTLFVAFFFTLLFGIMFGDAGQGLVLFLAGFVAGKANTIFGAYGHFATPLKAVGISSMIMGLLNGVFFTNEEILVKPTQAVLGFFMNLAGIAGEAPERILHLMPEKGNVTKLFYFFGFTVAVGVFLNSIGLIVNIVNQWSLKKYEKAFFAKTGLAGLMLFWYAIFIAIRLILGNAIFWYDCLGIFIPGGILFFGPAIWRLISGERPVLEHGFLVFVIEGFVEILETVSTYISNTVSFLRVGAFALSHAVLSFIVFTLSEKVMEFPLGSAFSLLIMILGNAIIILLEGMIVTIQVIRLQYYEFFSKFFTETGVAFAPFRFTKKGV
ncbi:MAG: V-type ATP synthase subunit I [Spirochaetaceae bacterium]|jgi:V/A-type H+-transporting ATPase subunit I|nr:V-type ATP synthase subunit I [Spirochaetaceae bacterium]